MHLIEFFSPGNKAKYFASFSLSSECILIWAFLDILTRGKTIFAVISLMFEGAVCDRGNLKLHICEGQTGL